MAACNFEGSRFRAGNPTACRAAMRKSAVTLTSNRSRVRGTRSSMMAASRRCIANARRALLEKRAQPAHAQAVRRKPLRASFARNAAMATPGDDAYAR